MIDVLPNEEVSEASTPLLPEERLYQLMIEHVYPETYNGYDVDACLIGQVALALGGSSSYQTTYTFVERTLRLPFCVAYWVYKKATRPEYCYDLPAALAMAREVLGLDETGRKRPPIKPEDAF